jgi:aquaporin Z
MEISVIVQDHPLRGDPHPADALHLAMYLAEALGTALLVFGGLSFVIILNSAPVFLQLLPEAGVRRAIMGALIGSVCALIAYSPIGKISGSHINPAVTLAFWLEGKMRWRDALAYGVAQCFGAVIGAAALAIWGVAGFDVGSAVTRPDTAFALGWPLLGETLCTSLLVALIFIVAARPLTQPFTPLINPPLFALLVWLEAPLSGTSTNPARSFGPAFTESVWSGHWIYWVGPLLGAAAAVGLLRLTLSHENRPKEARLFHFGHPGGLGK